MKLFRDVAAETDLDVILSYNHYTIQNTMLADEVEWLNEKRIGILNAAPFSARLLTNAPLPPWHKATDEVRAVCAKAAEHCRDAGTDIAKLALQFSVANESFASCVTGSANPDRSKQWCQWLDEPLDAGLLSDVQKILEPIHNWFYVEGRPENNDTTK